MDRRDIYVNLGCSGAHGATDSNGAIICNIIGGNAGTRHNPLNFSQLRTYLKYRLDKNISDKNRTFYIRGKYVGNVDLGDGDVDTGIFDIMYNSVVETPDGSDCPWKFEDGYTVNFCSWGDKPYKLDLSLTTTASSITKVETYLPSIHLFNTYDVKLHISNMQVQARTVTYNGGNNSSSIGAIVFYNYAPPRHNSECGIDDDEKYNNKIELLNCLFITNGGGAIDYNTPFNDGYIPTYGNINNVAYHIGRYTEVFISNCIFYSDDPDGAFVVQDKVPDGDGEHILEVKYKYIITNSIFLNIVELFRATDIYALFYGDSFRLGERNYYQHISDNVVSGDFNVYRDNPSSWITGNNWITNNFINNVNTSTIQYNFPIPSLSWDIDSMTDDDLHYMKHGWEYIGRLVGIKYDYTGSLYVGNKYTFGRRDGVGALYFPEMPDITVSLTPQYPTINSTVVCNIGIPNFHNDYLPYMYFWYIDGEYADRIIGAPPVYTHVVSKYGETEYTLQVSSHNGWYIKEGSSYTNTAVGLDGISITIETFKNGIPSDTFAVNETVEYVITNNTNYNLQTINSVDVNINGEIININIPKYGDKYVGTTEYTGIGDKLILCNVRTMDNEQKYFSKTITIEDVVSDVYYVDLSKEYEDGNKFKLKYVLYDDFEDKSIDSAFNVQFRDAYHVEYMYDEYVATTDVTDEKYVCRGIRDGKAYLEWSFVRDNVKDVPSMVLEIDNKKYKVSWNFISDRLNISGDSRYSIKYGEFGKDLSCSNTLHKINVRFEYDNGILNLHYSTDGILWYKSGFEVVLNSFNNMSLLSEGTSSTGIGYIFVQAESVDINIFNGLVKGTEEYPYTYTDMYDRIKVDGEGNFADIYKCRNWREVSNQRFSVDQTKQFEIDVWDARKYGPWMLRFLVSANFTGVMLSNGIIYNRPATIVSNLFITTTYNMFITWNDIYNTGNRIVLMRCSHRYTGIDKRTDIIGSTINSVSGFITLGGN